MVKDKPLKIILWSIGLTLGLVLSLAIGGFATSTPVSAANAYDISSYQGYVNDNQAGQLKNEVNFMILKAQNGGLYTDPQFNHNAYEMSSHHIPYGAYDYSLYANPAQAQSEASSLYQRAPQASFYVNDSEENNAGDQLNASTQAWANEIHQLTNKPAVLYSGLSFMNTHFTPQTRNAYDGLWIAAYGSEPDPAYHYDLWQYTDSHYSPALGESIDASVFPNGSTKPLSFWTGNGSDDYHPANTDNSKSDDVTPKPVVRRHRRHLARKAHHSVVVKPNRQTKNQNSSVIKPRQNRRGHKSRRNRLARKVHKITRIRKRVAKKINGRKTFAKKVRRRAKRLVKHGRRRTASKLIRKSRKYLRAHKSKVRIIYNPHYYRSKRVKNLQVTGKKGINLYTMKGRYFGHANPGTVLHVYRYLTVYHRNTGYMTKAVGIHYGRYDLFTSRKSLVKWYRPSVNNNSNVATNN